MLELKYISKHNIVIEDQSTKDILKKGFFGKEEEALLHLDIEEALYLIDVRNARCTYKTSTLSFNSLAANFWNSKKFIARYFTYKDWRDRGLVIKSPSSKCRDPNKTPIKEYPANQQLTPNIKARGVFFKTDLTTIIDDNVAGRELYSNYWLGQYGSYKAAERGQLNKLDIYETIFLIEKGCLSLTNVTKKEAMHYAVSMRREFPKLYEVYKDWREKGYIIKTGFKFGTHFRVYFPGARPMHKDDSVWVHSRHVIHVFPKESRLLISEWARAIRVSHSVKKTFILAVPGKSNKKKVDIDFILYHRRGGEAENPEKEAPKYAMLSLSEEEYLGGRELAGAIKEAKERKLELVIAIADRETAVTYYKVRQIKLPGSDAEYYEIDWMQP